MKSFRFNSQKVFLTYPQTPRRLSQKKLLSLISAKADVEDYLICQEKHDEGGYHLHAYFKFTNKLDKKSANCFDISYYSKNFHPHIEKPKKIHKLWEYIKKDGEYITNIVETRPLWLKTIEDSGSKQEFLLKTMWEIGRIDNYAGYRTYMSLWDEKMKSELKVHGADQFWQEEDLRMKVRAKREKRLGVEK